MSDVRPAAGARGSRHDLPPQPHLRAPEQGPGRGPRPRGADRVRERDDAVAPRRLVTIPISHYCEKARWALERAGLAYHEEPHVQGVHMLAARRAGGGTTVPVLVAPEGVFTQSEWIVRYADGHLAPETRLFTGDREVVALSRELDAGLGPDARRLIYALMLPHQRLILPYNNAGVPAWEARTLQAGYAVAERWLRHRLGIERPREDAARVHAAFDAIAERLQDGRRHLCGDRFTAADLTFACVAAAVVLPPEYGVTLPQPEVLPQPVASEVRAFRAHPAGAYALKLFAELRRSPAAAGFGA